MAIEKVDVNYILYNLEKLAGAMPEVGQNEFYKVAKGQLERFVIGVNIEEVNTPPMLIENTGNFDFKSGDLVVFRTEYTCRIHGVVTDELMVICFTKSPDKNRNFCLRCYASFLERKIGVVTEKKTTEPVK